MTEATLYGGVRSRRVTVRDLQLAKERGERWPMLTSYDMLTAGLFDEAGIPVLLVGDSAANNVLGLRNDRPGHGRRAAAAVRAVVRSTTRGPGGRRHAVRLVPGLTDAGARDRRPGS